ncbi:MAG: hypothetical protein QWI73_05960, partial [Alphaproteobacteria bacterium]|nr:hypothetical protein [Alphaproteobacteria bacterium]
PIFKFCRVTLYKLRYININSSYFLIIKIIEAFQKFEDSIITVYDKKKKCTVKKQNGYHYLSPVLTNITK